MARRAAEWTKLQCNCADIAFREHWGGLVEIACGESRVMLSYGGGLQRLAKLPPESAIALLKRLLGTAREEQRNRVNAELLSGYLERSSAE